jgi:hypothetical protein
MSDGDPAAWIAQVHSKHALAQKKKNLLDETHHCIWL